jgi:putative hydrolase of the HAD superfamily
VSPSDTVRGVIFDLWNTLAFTDHEPHPLNAIASAFGLAGEAGWGKVLERAMMTRRLSGIGEGLDAITAATGRRIASGWSRRELIMLWGEANNANRLYRDVLPALGALRRPAAGGPGYRMGILSNTQSFDLDFLGRSGLERAVDEICLSCDCGLLKPDPAIFRLASRRLGLPPDRILMVGDSRADDVEAARRAGLRAILLDRTGRGEEGSLTDLRDLAEHLKASRRVRSPGPS